MAEIEERNLFECHSLSLYKSSAERLDTSFLIELTLFIMIGSKMSYINMQPVKCLEVLIASDSELETLKISD